MRGVRDTVEEVVPSFVRREGVIGFLVVIGSLVLGFYIWESHQQREILTQILIDTQKLQQETLDDRKVKTEAIQSNTKTMEQLGTIQKDASQNIRILSETVAMRLAHDETRHADNMKRADKLLEQIYQLQLHSQRSENYLRQIKKDTVGK